jgi:B12-binding domain/radical SAM domain protein
MKADLILLHPPSIWDFRDKAFGPISDVIPSTPIFEMYPLGFISIAEYLHRHGYEVKIANIALSMMEKKFDVKKFISGLNAPLLGIDLHWLVHANGGIELAKLCKEMHPETKIMIGGLSSTYYSSELIRYDFVDFVVKGDSTEIAILKLLQELEKDKPDYSLVPNLVYKDGKVTDNGIKSVPESLDDFVIDLKFVVNMLSSYKDIKLRFPYKNYLKNPIISIFSVRGCTQNCITCGGSKYFYRKYCNRQKPAFRSPERMIKDLLTIESYVRVPVFILGDLQQGGNTYWKAFFKGIKKENIDLPFVFELFNPAPKEYFKELSNLAEFNLQISPETYSEDIRRFQGRKYSNSSLEKNIEYALNTGAKKFDLYYMIGLAKQTKAEVNKTLEYFDKRLAGFGNRVHFFISPLSPFLDPGSLAFDNPAKYHFKVLFKDLKSHHDALNKKSWKDFLNYESTLSREEIVEVTYETAEKLFYIKWKHGYISEEEYTKQRRLLLSKDLNILSSEKELYFGEYSVLNIRAALKFLYKKFIGNLKLE